MKRVARALFAVGLVGSALALGAIHTSVLMASAVVFAASAFFAWRGESRARLRVPALVLLTTCVGLTLFTVVQAVPLPLTLVARITPANADTWARSLLPLHEAAPTWAALSLDPLASRVEVLRGLTYVTAFLAAVRIARDRDGMGFLELLLLGSVLTMAVAALAHPALGAERVFGVYRPVDDIAARHVAPLLNANHLAGYVNIGICLAAAEALSKRPHIPRVYSVGATAFLVVVEIWIGSRGGVGSMVLALLLVAALSRITRTAADRALSLSPLLLGGVGVASLGILVLAGSEAALSELTVADLSKLQMFQQSMRVLASSPLVGIGRGAFASVFPAFRTGVGDFTYTYPENILAQWSVEWGAPVAAAALLACAWSLRPSVLLARSRPPVGAWVALVALFVHNLVDFSSEVPGVVVALVTCAALVVGGEAGITRSSRAGRTSSPSWLPIWARRPQARLAALGLCTVVAAVVCVPALGHGVDDDGVALRDRVLRAPRDIAAFDTQVRADMLRHPAEPYFPFLGALRATLAQDTSPVPWIQRTLERARIYGRAHLLLARALFRRAPAQARLEYRFAYEQDLSQLGPAADEGSRLVTGYEDARELAPGRSAAEVQVLVSLSAALQARLPATAARLDESVDGAGVWAEPALERRAAAAVRDLDDDSASWCQEDRSSCARIAHDLVNRLEAQAPDSCRSDALAAQLARVEADGSRAREILEHALRSDHDGAQCVGSLIELAMQEPDARKADDQLDRIARIACEAADACVPSLLALAGAEEARHQPARAFGFTKQAWDRDATDALLARLADRAAAAGMHAEALEDFRKLSLRHPDDARWPGRVDEERTAIFGGTLIGGRR